jgi:hypothetical protein
MKKNIVMTWEQLVALSNLIEAMGNPLMMEVIYLPDKYEWMREYLESDQLLDYLSTGFNFLSPVADDMNFGYGYTLTRFTIINQIKSSLAAAGNWMRCHWRALNNATTLALESVEVQFPTLAEFQEECYQEMLEFSQREYDDLVSEDEYQLMSNHRYREDCRCGGAGACIECNPKMFIAL